jgi:hypothetical protein
MRQFYRQFRRNDRQTDSNNRAMQTAIVIAPCSFLFTIILQKETAIV